MRTATATAACLLLVAASAAPAHAATIPPIAPDQELVVLLAPHGVRERPELDARRVTTVATRRPITGERTTLPVIERATDARGRTWLRVRLPGRALKTKPPPRSGWISASNTRRSTTDWHVVVDVGARRVFVYRDARLIGGYHAIVGKPSTPTPRGEFFVEENVRLSAGESGAPFALATSARSSVLQEFAGGPGQIALHGLVHVGGQLGTAASHGCVRLANGAVTWLAKRIAAGVPITIV